MSYNIDSWRTKKIEKFLIPLDAFFAKEGFTVRVVAPGSIEIYGDPEMLKITGTTGSDNVLSVDSIYVGGEGSGYFHDDVFLDVLGESTGYLEAVLVWEGGDSITRLIVSDGNVAEEEIEL